MHESIDYFTLKRRFETMIYDRKGFRDKVASKYFMLSHCIAEDDLRRSRKKNNRSRRKRAISASPRETRLDYLSSTWGKLLVKLSAIPGGPLISSREGKLFRRRFRVPWDVFVDLLQKSKERKLFGENSLLRFDCCGSTICPYAIKLLGVLRILGRNWCCDDVAEATGMGETTVRRAFLDFCGNFVDNYYDTYIHRPEGEKLKRMMDVYARMGLPGCIGSTDCGI